jgi:hypothetical protein
MGNRPSSDTNSDQKKYRLKRRCSNELQEELPLIGILNCGHLDVFLG